VASNTRLFFNIIGSLWVSLGARDVVQMKRNDFTACRIGCELSATVPIFTRSIVKGNCAQMRIYHPILIGLFDLFCG
jgi:hypothetical protein